MQGQMHREGQGWHVFRGALRNLEGGLCHSPALEWP